MMFRLMNANLTIPVGGPEPQVKMIKVVLEHFQHFFFLFASSSSPLVFFHKRWLGLFKAVLPASLFMPQTMVVVLISTPSLHLMFILIFRFVFSICLLYGLIYM